MIDPLSFALGFLAAIVLFILFILFVIFIGPNFARFGPWA